MRNKIFRICCLLLLPALSAVPTLGTGPNIIFIMVDALRPDHLGCYGYDLPTTPNIDRFAAESTRFEHAVAQSSWTLWSLESIMTSRYPNVLLAANEGLKMRPGTELLLYPTLAEVLKNQGYSTSAVVANPLLGIEPGFKQGYDSFDNAPAKVNMDCRETSPSVTEHATARLREVKEKPFFLFLLYMDAHAPYYTNQGFTFGDSAKDRAIRDVIAADHPPVRMVERQEALREYDSEIGYTDHYLGLFFEELKKQGLYDDALIVFFADHGEEFLEHGGYGHMTTVYQEVLRVPLIVKFPGQQKGRVIAGTFPLLDLAPSVLLQANIAAGALGMQGKAIKLTALLRSAEQPFFAFTQQQVQSITNGQYKLIHGPCQGAPGEPPEVKLELYDLTADPLERHNLVKEKPEVVANLLALLKEREVQPTTAEGKNPLATTDAELLKQLEALGYINK